MNVFTKQSYKVTSVQQESNIGCEFSGYDTRQQPVMGLVEYGAVATLVLADPKYLWDVPASWTLEQATTVPLFYATVSKK